MGPRNEEVNDQIAFIPASAIKMARDILLLCRLISSFIEAIEKFSKDQLKSFVHRLVSKKTSERRHFQRIKAILRSCVLRFFSLVFKLCQFVQKSVDFIEVSEVTN